MMLKMYFLAAWRNFIRQKLFSAINVLGLAIGVACCLLIFLFVQHEWRYDRFHKNAGSIYRVLSEIKQPNGSTRIVAIEPLPLAKALQDEFPEVIRAVRFNEFKGAVRYEDKVFTERLLFADTGIFEAFSFPLLAGNTSGVLSEPNTVVISESMAHKYFGGENALGKRLTITPDDKSPQDFVVTGVAQKIPANSSIKFDFLLPFIQAPGYDRQITNWGASNCNTYIQLADSHTGKSLEAKLAPFVEKYFGERINDGRKSGAFTTDSDAWQLHLQPLTAVHLDPSIKGGLQPPGNPLYSYILSGIAIVILLIACMNFITLAIARSASRTQEIGMRKVLGAAKKQLFKQYWGESLLLSLLAVVAGVLLAELFLPAFNALANTQLAFDVAGITSLVFVLTGLMLSISLLAGSYPALLLSRFQPVAALKLRLKSGGKSYFGKALVVFQFLLSVLLITSTFIMSRQLDFLKHKDLGYDADQVVAIPTYMLGEQQQQLAEIYRHEIERHDKILRISGVNNSFTRGMMTSGIKTGDTSAEAWFYIVHDDFLETMGIELVQGRDFSRELQTDVLGSVIVNEALVDYFGWSDPLGKQLEMLDNRRPTVIGVTKNFHYRSLHNQIEPAVIVLHRGFSNSNILIKISRDDIAGTLAFLEHAWKQVAPDAPFAFYFLDDDVQKQYLAEERWTAIVRNASALAVIIACLGLFGLAALAATQRFKEIGIRKVLGASVPAIVRLISKEFVLLVCIANLIAWPVAYFAMDKWLQDFAYRVEIGWWMFALAGGIALLIALLTVSTQAVKAALANPVESLRYE